MTLLAKPLPILYSLRKSGLAQLILVSPLNFKKAVHWGKYHPSSKLSNMLKDMGFEILDWKEDIVVKEPLDRHGNFLCWTCLGFVVQT